MDRLRQIGIDIFNSGMCDIVGRFMVHRKRHCDENIKIELEISFTGINLYLL